MFAAGSQSEGRIGSVFRDREDLPAAEDLTASVKQALAASKALVVLCSPAAKASPWVAREIAVFRELHPDRPVLAALLRGEPDEAFPELLREGYEPLAADLRKDGDGARLGFLKIIAGIVGVPLDALVQRDSQRQMRRVMAITGMVAFFALAMGVMTVIALQARSEALAQRESAEGLIEYMLTDLREDLSGAAGVAVMTKVNQRALAYYERQGNLGDLPPDSLARRARAVGRLGEDAMNRQDFLLARRNLEERMRTTLGLLERDPNNVQRKFEHALSLNRLALLSQAEGKNKQSETELTNSWNLLTEIRAWEISDIEWQRTTTLVAGNLCAIDVLNDNIRDATLDKCRIAVNLGRTLATDDNIPSRSSYDLVFNLIWYSVALEHNNQAQDALNVRNGALRLSDRLVSENPGNRKIRAQRMEAYAYLSSYAPPKERRAMLKTAIAIASELTTVDPQRTDWITKLKSYQRRIEE